MTSTTFTTADFSNFSGPFPAHIYRPIAINPALFAPLNLELADADTRDVTMVTSSTSTSASSRCCSSTESSTAPGKVRRGRPQQEIADGADSHSQKKRHRRLYARQYRAQMRQKVENVKSLSDEKEQLEDVVKALQQEVARLRTVIVQKDLIFNILGLNNVNISSVTSSSSPPCP
uniref:BZIP domain-containing protein n=1 Tax=Caenorhabditis japonica TaxID=281687 RepID=A0A8R1DFG9_CAEJA